MSALHAVMHFFFLKYQTWYLISKRSCHLPIDQEKLPMIRKKKKKEQYKREAETTL